MMPLSPALFLAAASALVADDRRVRRPPRFARGDTSARTEEFDPLGRDCHRPLDGVTTAAFIAHVGYWSHRRCSGSSAWPLPLDADCDTLASIGLDRGVLGVDIPEAGDICLRWSRAEQRFVRASIVLWTVEVPPSMQTAWAYDCHVLEGSAIVITSEAREVDSAERPFETTVLWARRAWVTCCPGLGDRFLSWVDLDARIDTTRIRRVA